LPRVAAHRRPARQLLQQRRLPCREESVGLFRSLRQSPICQRLFTGKDDLKTSHLCP